MYGRTLLMISRSDVYTTPIHLRLGSTALQLSLLLIVVAINIITVIIFIDVGSAVICSSSDAAAPKPFVVALKSSVSWTAQACRGDGR
jgi:hypothetical protein